MRTLILNKFLHRNGGSETYIFKLGEALEQHGHEVQYFGMEHEGRCAEVPSPNGADVSTGHSVNGVPVTSTLSPGLSTLVSQLAGYLRSTTSPSPTMGLRQWLLPTDPGRRCPCRCS